MRQTGYEVESRFQIFYEGGSMLEGDPPQERGRTLLTVKNINTGYEATFELNSQYFYIPGVFDPGRYIFNLTCVNGGGCTAAIFLMDLNGYRPGKRDMKRGTGYNYINPMLQERMKEQEVLRKTEALNREEALKRKTRAYKRKQEEEGRRRVQGIMLEVPPEAQLALEVGPLASPWEILGVAENNFNDIRLKYRLLFDRWRNNKQVVETIQRAVIALG